ncbi:hypothetical protein PTSG_00746 [Salpingoeca rosetta]|uniref:Tudor domain-containing protein n=1 Tax=Salpingoeca rosetta (strain ATCC 50818 / BSB-021) TaxID=946362 RepID=F2TXC8_SALR5|nr:uncharacterized protein PTSG_00746 [Salpingoeca rosetta]EGD76037.1 hypothetical protein PTSG_00746 [Salpingoeca rosetta]|eukprot:XP_004998212.1 hypothetical protein PTSG_00746 [Salpingoeca rosetta]
MDTQVGEEVFRVGQGDQEEVWDDSELVNAYQAAINTFEVQQEKRQGRRRKEHRPAAKEWKVGDECRAVWTEDEEIYDAEITSISADGTTCTVLYTEYGNSEEQPLTALLPPFQRGPVFSVPKHLEIRDDDDDDDDDDDAAAPGADGGDGADVADGDAADGGDGAGNAVAGTSSDDGVFQQSTHQRANDVEAEGGVPMKKAKLSSAEAVEGDEAQTATANAAAPSPWTSGVTAPTALAGGGPDGDAQEAALANMLMAWYQSGFYTGYYQALQQLQQQQQQE